MILPHEDDVASAKPAPSCCGCPALGKWYDTELEGVPYRQRICQRTTLVLPADHRTERPGWCPLSHPKAGHDKP